jgi:hypothetical protein
VVETRYCCGKRDSQRKRSLFDRTLGVGTKGLVAIANIRWLANVSAFVDEIESIRVVLGLRPNFRVSSQDADRKSD